MKTLIQQIKKSESFPSHAPAQPHAAATVEPHRRPSRRPRLSTGLAALGPGRPLLGTSWGCP
eukprot:366410-Chlamydomonas_euryale.AAC.3